MTVRLFRRGAPAVVVAAIAALALTSCSSTLNDAATVTYPEGGNGETTMHVAGQAFESELNELVVSKSFRESLAGSDVVANEDQLASQIAATWLGFRIAQTAVDREFDAAGLEISDADIKAAEGELSNPTQEASLPISPFLFDGAMFKEFSPEFRRTLAERRARAKALLKVYQNPTEAMKKEFFEANKKEIACRRVAHVVVATEAEAQSVLRELEGGAPVADVARKRSIDETSKAAGGDIGCPQAGVLQPEFEAAVQEAPFDTPSGPVKTEAGYHVFVVTEQLPTYESIAERIGPALQSGASINSQIGLVKVRVDPRYGTPGGPTQNQDGTVTFLITPPSVPDPATERDPAPTTTTTVPFLAG